MCAILEHQGKVVHFHLPHFYLFIYLFLAVSGLRFCAKAFSSCSERAPLFIAVRGPLTIAASLVAEQKLQTRRLSSCGSRAQLLRGMWDLPRPGLEPVSPALAGRFLTTVPPGKPPFASLLIKPKENQIMYTPKQENRHLHFRTKIPTSFNFLKLKLPVNFHKTASLK